MPVCSIVTYFAKVKTIDYNIEGFDRAKVAMIITDKPDDICAALTAEFESGVTMLTAECRYLKKLKSAIYFIVNRFQVGKMKNIVHSVDPTAYITISEIADVFR